MPHNLTLLLVAVGVLATGFDQCRAGDLGYWRFEDGSGSIAQDSSGNGNPAFLTNGSFGSSVPVPAIPQTGILDTGTLVVNGANSYASVPYNPTLSPSTAVTVEAWVRVEGSLTLDAAITGRQYANDNRNSFNIGVRNNNGSVFFEVTNPLGQDAAAELFTGLTPNRWYHLAGVYDGSAISLYQDGYLIASKPFVGQIGYGASKPVLIGADNEGAVSAPQYFFPGSIDEVRISDAALMPKQFLSTQSGEFVTVASLGNRGLFNFDQGAESSVFAGTSSGLLSPFDVKYDLRGNVYVADVLKSQIRKIDPMGQVSVFADAADGVISPSGMAFGPTGDLYVSNFLTNTITKVSRNGVGTIVAGPSAGLNSPFGLAVDSHGNLFVADISSRRVVEISPSGSVSTFADLSDGLLSPFAVTVDSQNNVFVADVLLSKVFKFTPAGVGSVYAGPSAGLTTPSGLAIDSAGNLLVSNYLSNSIVEITAAGLSVPFASSADGIRSPFGLDIPPGFIAGAGAGAIARNVPEPASIWLSMSAGLAGVAVAIARRRRLLGVTVRMLS